MAEWNLLNYKSLIEKNPMHIATINKNNKPNLSVASDIYVYSEKIIIISNNEMINTPDCINHNPNIVLTSFSDKWAGLRMTGTATYETEDKYFEKCNELFNNETATPKGVIVVLINKVEGIA